MVSPTEEIRAKLDEMGVEYTFDDSDDYEIVEWQGSYNLWWQFIYDPDEEEPYGELRLLEAGGSTHLTPEQAIAATVGRRDTMGLWPEWEQVLFANVTDEVAQDNLNECVHELLDKAAMVSNAREPSDAVIERIERFCTDYAQCLMDSTILVKRNYESMNRRAVEKAEVVEDRLIRELAEDMVTVGAGTCKRVYHPNRITKRCICSNCGYAASDERWAYCPKCGHKYVHGEVEERWKRAGRKAAE